MITSCIGHLKNVSSLTYADLPHIDIFIIRYKKTHLLISPPISLENSLKFWEAVKLTMAYINFPKIQISFKSSNFSLATNTLLCFLYSDRLILFIFKKMYIKKLSPKNHSLPVNCSFK